MIFMTSKCVIMSFLYLRRAIGNKIVLVALYKAKLIETGYVQIHVQKKKKGIQIDGANIQVLVV